MSLSTAANVVTLGALDVVLSPNGQMAYISGPDGSVKAIDVASGKTMASWAVGTQLGGMDVSPDGRYLIVAEQQFADDTARVHRLDLQTGEVKDFTLKLGPGGAGFYDAAWTQNGTVLLTQNGGGNFLRSWTLDMASGLFAGSNQTYYGKVVLNSSADHSKIVIGPTGLSSSDVYIYDTVNKTTSRFYGPSSGGNIGVQAVANGGALIAVGTYSQLVVYDSSYKQVVDLSALRPELHNSAVGVTFSADGSELFVFDSQYNRVLEYSTSDWSFIRGIGLGSSWATDTQSIGLLGDRLVFGGDGHYLLASSMSGIFAIDLHATWDPGSDKADTIVGDSGDNRFFGFGGADFIDGGPGNDELHGDAGDDVLVGGDGNDLLYGGDGVDTADYSSASAGVTVDLGKYGMQSTGGAGFDTLDSIENLKGSAFADTLVGSASANVLDGGAGDDALYGRGGADTLHGGAGNDILVGGAGDDVLDGGDGFDIASYEDAASGVTVDLSKSGVLQNTRGGGVDVLTSIEGVKGSAFNDVLRGSAGDNSFEGGRGDDIIDGGAGNDTAIYAGPSTNYTWTRNADGTWTVRDNSTGGGEGVDTLLNIEMLRFSDRTVTLSSSATDQTVDALLHPGPTQIVASGGAYSDGVFSADGKSILVADAEGYVVSYSAATGEAQGRWKVGTQLGGMDVSADGRYLYVGEQVSAIVSTDPANVRVTGVLHRLDLVTGQVTNFAAPSGQVLSFYDVAVSQSGKVVLSQASGGGNNSLALWVFDPATAQFTNLGGRYSDRGVLSVSEDRSKILYGPTSTTDTTIYIYDTSAKAVPQTDTSAFNAGIQAISNLKGLIARGLYSSNSVMDFTGKVIVDLTKAHPETVASVSGMAFSADGSRLFVLDAHSNRIVQLSTSDWSVERGIQVGGSLDLSNSAYGDRISVSSDGHYLLVFSGSSVTTVDLQAAWGGGSDKADILVGGAGDDQLFGFGGDDVMKGGGGTNLFDGGEGVDTVDYSDAARSVTVDLGESGPQYNPGVGRDTLYSIENLVGSAFNDTLTGSRGANRLEGRGGDDVLSGGGGTDVLDGGAGFDTASYVNASSGVTVDLGKTGPQDTHGFGVNTLISIEGLKGSYYADTLTGDANANTLDGGAGDDVLNGGAGDDTLIGGAGNDTIDGGDGNDTVVYKAAKSSYSVVQNADGSTTVTDLRSGAPDGTDKLINVEHIVFAPEPSAAEITSEMNAILRTSGSAALATLSQDLLSRWTAGALSADQVTAQIIKTAGATTSVATLAYEFFTGKIPGQAGVDYLVSPTGPNGNNLNSAYYQSFNLENRYINFAVNLGKVGEGAAAFTAKYGAMTLFDATREAYKAIFGAAPTDTKIHALIDTRADYFASYGGDGANGIGTKAAMVGWLLAEAQKADLGVMVKSNDAWLTDLADGSAPFAIDILDPAKGYYKTDFVYGGT